MLNAKAQRLRKFQITKSKLQTAEISVEVFYLFGQPPRI